MPKTKIDYDVVVGGASISGLLTARELAKNGNSVLIVEEHKQVGIPEHCDGLVSKKALKDLSISPDDEFIQTKINDVKLHSPSENELYVNSENLQMIVLNRSKFDQHLANNVAQLGCEIYNSTTVQNIEDHDDYSVVNTSNGNYTCKFFVDAMGCKSLLRESKSGVLQAGKYIAKSSMINDHSIEIFFDQLVTPGFFKWIIPMSNSEAKVGAAGKEINPFTVLDKLITDYDCHVIDKIAAPIIIRGPIDRFVFGNTVKVGDSAAQTKPSTAGGIYSGGRAGIIAGQNIHKALYYNDRKYLLNYEKEWKKIFAREFNITKSARTLFTKLDNNQIDIIFKELGDSPDLFSELGNTDFDFHSVFILRALGVKRVFKMLKVFLDSELYRYSLKFKS